MRYDPARVSFEQLLAVGMKHDCASSVYPVNEAQRAIVAKHEKVVDRGAPKEIRLEGLKYYLAKTPWRHVPMTEWQAVRLNARLAKKQPLKEQELFSRQQLGILGLAKLVPDGGWPVAVGVPIDQAFRAVKKLMKDG